MRIITRSLSLGSSCDWFIPEQDMPSSNNSPYEKLFEDIITTPFGNSFLYEKGKINAWQLNFESITTQSYNLLKHICNGWHGLQQVTTLFYGSHVTGTNQSAGTYSASQIWGTGFCRMSNVSEVISDSWNCTIEITQFGSNQHFS